MMKEKAERNVENKRDWNYKRVMEGEGGEDIISRGRPEGCQDGTYED